MATIKKSVLKKIVKECLKEILLEENFVKNCFAQVLQEGVGNISSVPSSIIKTEQRLKQKFNHSQRKQQQPLTAQQPLMNPNFKNNIKNYVENLAPNNEVMQDIFADTASTTLQEQNDKGHATPPVPQSISVGGNGMAVPDQAEQVVSNYNPDELFMGSEKWAQIAFAPSSKNKN